jgi:4-hydroxy-tetrahydrodipicolinate synthase
LNVDFGNILTAMVTPFHPNSAVNYGEARKLARYLVESGSDGLVIAGTTGESPTLTKEEKVELFQAVVEEVGGKAVVLAGTGGNSTSESIELTRAAQRVGVDGVMLVAPYYNKPSQEGIFQHFKTIAENIELPIMLYNIPGRTSVNILPRTMLRLAQIRNIVALKEASGSMDQVSELRRILPTDFDIYSGDDSLTLPVLALGGKGVVSVVSHLVGAPLKEMVNAFISGNIALAKEIHLKLFPLFKGMFVTTNPVPIKAALNMTGWEVGIPRLPLVEATAEEKDAIRQVLESRNLV